jgi:hypothetical protein
MDKAEIEKILIDIGILTEQEIKESTSSLTALIIKWLESKKVKIIEDCWENVERDKTRNQLITELIGEIK